MPNLYLYILTVLFQTIQVPPIRARVDLEAIAMKGVLHILQRFSPSDSWGVLNLNMSTGKNHT